MSVKCITPGQEEFVSSHKRHTHVSRCSALPQQCDGTWTEIWQSWHSTKHSPRGIFHRANRVCPRFHINAISSYRTAQKWPVPGDTYKEGRREQEARTVETLKEVHSCLGCCRTWLFFPAQVISFSIWEKKVGAATSRKYKQETHLKLREGDSSLTLREEMKVTCDAKQKNPLQ